MKRFQIMLPEPMMAHLKEIADEKGISTSEVIRYIVDGYLEAKEQRECKEYLDAKKTGVL